MNEFDACDAAYKNGYQARDEEIIRCGACRFYDRSCFGTREDCGDRENRCGTCRYFGVCKDEDGYCDKAQV